MHAVVQFVRSDGLHLWWRHGEQGKVFATWVGGRWAWAFRRGGDGLLDGGGWTWDRERGDIRDFVVIARGITPDLSNEEVQRRCSGQGASVGEWVAWNDVLPEMTSDAVAAACTRVPVVATVAWSEVPVDSLVLVGESEVVLYRKGEYKQIYTPTKSWGFISARATREPSTRVRILATDVEQNTSIQHVQRLTWDALSKAEERAAVGLTARP